MDLDLHCYEKLFTYIIASIVLVGCLQQEPFIAENLVYDKLFGKYCAPLVINMEHLSAALEVRLWRNGVDKNNPIDADRKKIAYAELMSDNINFLLDVVPSYNQNGSITYSNRIIDQNEEDRAYVRTADINSPFAVFNIAPHADKYVAGELRLTIVDENGISYTLDVPALNFVAGKRTILNVEWKKPTSAFLPAGIEFNTIVSDFMTANPGITKIKFITNSPILSEHALVTGCIYLLKKGDTLEIHTSADQFIANKDSSYMFQMFQHLKSIDLGNNFSTSSTTNMEGMFECCYALDSLDLSSFDTKNVTNMYSLFFCCKSMLHLDISNFNTEKVTNMRSMFNGCKYITSLDISALNTSKVTDMSWMFSNCEKLANIDVCKFDTQNVTDMSRLFENCYSLTSLNITNFNTKNVKKYRLYSVIAHLLLH